MKAKNKYTKNYNQNKESSCLKYWSINDLYRRITSQKLPVNNFKWFEGTSQLNEDFIKNYNASSKE